MKIEVMMYMKDNNETEVPVKENEKQPIHKKSFILRIITLVAAFTLCFPTVRQMVLVIRCFATYGAVPNYVINDAWSLSICSLFVVLGLVSICKAIEDKIYNKKRKVLAKIFTALLIIVGFFSYLFMMLIPDYLSRAHAPIIYLYPEETTDISVRLDLVGELVTTYPFYDSQEGWNVEATPEGVLTDASGRRYSYLFWEGDLAIEPDLSRGFCVRGEDTAAFLEDSLEKLGLSDTEANDFIMYWLPQMEANAYNVITFQTDAYERVASLNISPEPDTVIRAMMLWYEVDTYVEIEAQDLSAINPTERIGFTVVEWGGIKLE